MTTPVFLNLHGGGAIGLVSCPGRFAPLATDVDLIASARVERVLSLIEDAERPETIDRLPKLLAERGVGWRHWPVKDFGVPDSAADLIWPSLADDLHQRLDRGGRVLVHCWGGLGRSGMVALRLLVERGEPVDAALDRLRAIRPGAVETGAQLAWARSGRLRMGPIADQMGGK